MFRAVPMTNIGSFHYTHSNVICHTGWMTACEETLSTSSMYRCVYSSRLPDDGQRHYPKHLEFYCKNKFEKSRHLVDFIIRINFTLQEKLNKCRFQNY